jgi:FAD binding domain of DNA photolyase
VWHLLLSSSWSGAACSAVQTLRAAHTSWLLQDVSGHFPLGRVVLFVYCVDGDRSPAMQSLRMVTACFLTEYLNISWVEGARWYHDTLVRSYFARPTGSKSEHQGSAMISIITNMATYVAVALFEID